MIEVLQILARASKYSEGIARLEKRPGVWKLSNETGEDEKIEDNCRQVSKSVKERALKFENSKRSLELLEDNPTTVSTHLKKTGREVLSVFKLLFVNSAVRKAAGVCSRSTRSDFAVCVSLSSVLAAI